MTFKEYTDALVKLSEEYTRGVEQLRKALEELIEQHTPAEPLIKDERIRKAVRAWAILNRIDEVNYCLIDEDGSSLIYTTEASSLVLDFCFEIEELEFGKIYTIAKLCGEEEDD